MDELKDFDKAIDKLNNRATTITRKAAVIAVNFSKERFRKGNWHGSSVEPWQKRKKEDKNSRRRAILVKKAVLMRDVQIIRQRPTYAIVGTSRITQKYARIHNEGGKVVGVAKVGSYTRKAHTRKRSGRKPERVTAHQVKGHSRKVNFKMPKRQYIGHSAELQRRISEMIKKEFIAELNNI
jgi:phage gpG-like protein